MHYFMKDNQFMFNFCLVSVEALSHTESQYSSRGRIKEIYICSKAFRLILNLSALIRLSFTHAFSVIMLIWSVHVPELDKVIPKCL